MEVKLTEYVLQEGEVLTAEVTPPIPITKNTPTEWVLSPDIDSIYTVTVESNIAGVVYNEKIPSLNELLNKLNTLTLGIKRTEKEELLEADIRSIVSCISIEQYTEAQAQITMARELWII